MHATQVHSSLPRGLHWRSSNQFVIASVAIAVFTVSFTLTTQDAWVAFLTVFQDTFLYGLLIPVFPTVIYERCAVVEEKVQLFTAVAVGLSGAGNLIGACFFGYLADHVRNRRTSLLLGLAIFIGATLMIWVAKHVAFMCIGRFLQGAASAAVWAVGLALLADTVGKSQVPIAMGYVNIGFSCGTVVGPIVGGITYSFGGFDATMGVAVGLLCLDVILRLLIVEKKSLPAEWLAHGADAEGPSSTPDARTPLLQEQHQDATRSHAEEPEESPDIEFAYQTLVKSSRLLVNLVCALVQAVTMTAFEVTLPIHLREIAGYEPFKTALVFIPLMVPALIGPIVGRVCEKVGNRPVASTGYVICGVILILLRLHTRDEKLQQFGLFIGLGLIGISMCMIMTPVLSDIFGAVEDLEKEKPGRFGAYGAFAQAYGLFEFSYSAGMLIGPVLAGWIKSEFGWSGLTLILGTVNILTVGTMVSLKA